MFRELLFNILFFCLISPVFSQVNDTTVTADTLLKSFRLFEDDEIIEISLRFNLSTYFREKTKKESMKADFTINPGKPDSINREIKLKTRGIFRNRYCLYSPIELNFRKNDFGYTDLDKINKIKLVNQCSSGSDDEGYVLREYLIYKLFNVLTDTSFRVRLLRINFIDSENKKKTVKQYGFFIEPLDMLEKRTHTIEVRSTTLTQRHIIPRSMDRLSIFNYMIGNFDWSIPGPHNVKILKSLTNFNVQLGIVVPYDFDWSGVVNATYAVPAEETGVNSVRERLFLGICRDNSVFKTDLQEFSRNKEKMYRIINEFPHLRPRDRADITGFLDEFFNQLKGGGNSILFNLQAHCKNL